MLYRVTVVPYAFLCVPVDILHQRAYSVMLCLQQIAEKAKRKGVGLLHSIIKTPTALADGSVNIMNVLQPPYGGVIGWLL